MTSGSERESREKDCMRQIEELRTELHRRMGGRYEPDRVGQLVTISQELDKLVVEVTRQQWTHEEGAGSGPAKKKKRNR